MAPRKPKTEVLKPGKAPKEVVDPIDRTKLALHEDYYRRSLVDLKGIEALETMEQEAWAGEQLTKVQAFLKSHEAERTELTKPINKAKRDIDAAFKPGTDLATEVKDLLKDLLAGAQERRLAAQQAARALAAEAARAGDSEACQDALAAIPDDFKAKGAGCGWAWIPTVVDKALVPDIFKVVDEALLVKAGRPFADSETPPTIPGVVFERKAIIRATGK